jgi:hypothetical protein
VCLGTGALTNSNDVWRVRYSCPWSLTKRYTTQTCIAPCTLNFGNLGTRRWVVSFTPWPFYLGRKNSRTHWAGRRVGTWASMDTSREKFCPTGNQTLVVQSAKWLYWLSYPSSVVWRVYINKGTSLIETLQFGSYFSARHWSLPWLPGQNISLGYLFYHQYTQLFWE